MNCFSYLYFLDLKQSICSKACLTVDYFLPLLPATHPPPIPKKLLRVICWFFSSDTENSGQQLPNIFLYYETLLYRAGCQDEIFVVWQPFGGQPTQCTFMLICIFGESRVALQCDWGGHLRWNYSLSCLKRK